MKNNLKIKKLARGTRIITGDEAFQRRQLLKNLIKIAEFNCFEEIILPSVEKAEIYTDKAGGEILGQMYAFDGKGDEPERLCLRPEATATIQLIADEHYKFQKDVKFWYFEKCWRYERPQRGRYREFWQFGCEWINPSFSEAKQISQEIACRMIRFVTADYELNESVNRGLDYYVEDGFEISIASLGAQKQVCGGGRYKQGIGFAIGFDRLILCGQ